jgi:tetratricopeptide (TPR) repeat protein
MPLPPDARLGPYHVLGKIGVGGMGEVYRAKDTRLGRYVALKLLGEGVLRNATARDRFFREAHTASALNHPNIITIHDIGEAEAGYFIAMELVEGETVRTLLRGATTVDQLIAIGSQVAKALAAAHSSGIVHRDIKPENIMIRPDGYVKVLDFGLARSVENAGNASVAVTAGTVTQAGFVLGTVPYMSPEQVKGDPLTPTSDIFSLGIVLYEFATRVHPFASASHLSIAASILSHAPIPPARLNPELPAAIGELLVEMLDKNPQRRPTAAAVALRLTSLGSARTDAPSMASGRALPLVGREQQLRELESSFRTVVAEGGMLHSITAEGGYGKTTLVDHFLRTVCEREQCLVARGRCSERLAGTEAFLPLLEALEGMVHDPGADDVARTLRLLAPDWYAEVRPSSTGLKAANTGRTGSWEQMKRQLNALFRELTRTRPLVLFLDDVHWADASTLDLMTYVADRFDSLRLLLLMAYRPGEAANNAPFSQLRSHVRFRGKHRETTVAPFNRPQVQRYLDINFSGHTFPDAFVALLYERTEGAPLFLVDLMRQLVEQQVVTRADNGWRVARPVHDLRPEMPASVRSLIQRTAERLSEDDRQVLVAGSVQGFEFDSAVVARTLQIAAEDVEERLERIERAHGIIRLIEEHELSGRTPSLRYAFTHHYHHNVFHETLRGARRQKLSAATAAAVREYRGAAGVLASQLAMLYEAAHDFQQAAVHFLAAAKHAAKVFANKETVLLARRGLDALTALEPSADRDRLELQLQAALGFALTNVAGYASTEAEAAYLRTRVLCDRLGDAAGRVAALFGIYRYYIVRGRLRAANEIGVKVLALATESGDPVQMVVGHNAFGPPLIQMGAFTEAIHYLSAASAAYAPSQRPALRAVFGTDIGMTALLWRAMGLWFVGRISEAEEVHASGLAMALEDSTPFELSYAHCMSAWFDHCRGRVAGVREHAERAIQIAGEHDLAYWFALGVIFRAWAMAAAGEETPESSAALQKGLEQFQQKGVALNLPLHLSLLADTHRRKGNVAAGLEAIATALDIVTANEDRCWEPELLRLRGEFQIMDDSQRGTSTTAGEESFRAAIERAHTQESYSLALRAAVSLAGLLSAQRRTEEARTLLASALDRFPDALHTIEIDAARAQLDELTRG